MHFILEQGGDVKEGKAVALQQWLAANEKELAQNTPDGVEYIGTFVVIYSSEKEAGFWRGLWRLDSYGAQDNMAAAMSEDSVFSKLLAELAEFFDQSPGANWSNTLMKAATDATIWE